MAWLDLLRHWLDGLPPTLAVSSREQVMTCVTAEASAHADPSAAPHYSNATNYALLTPVYTPSARL
jgi:hypothetical protein